MTLQDLEKANNPEVIHISRASTRRMEIRVEGDTIVTQETMKVLGVLMDDKMTWSRHIASNINKLNRFTGSLRFIRGRLSEEQFLQVLTSQYYGTCYYGAPAWLGSHTRKMDIRKLNSLHYRLLRTAVCDWKNKNKTSREELDKMGRVRPTTWAHYTSASTAIKIIRDDQPTRLNGHLRESLYRENRSGRVRFFDNSKMKQGRQAFANRLKDTFDRIAAPLTFKESDATLRRILKKELGFITQREQISLTS